MVKRRYAVIPLWYRSISFYRAYNKRKFVRYENVERKWMQRKLGRALLIIWFSNALRCVALRCVACIGQGKRAHSWLGMRATKARLIPRRLRLIIPDRLYAHAPVSLARGFFSTLLFASRTAASESAVRATFFTCHHRSTNPTTFLVHRSRSPRFYLATR